MRTHALWRVSACTRVFVPRMGSIVPDYREPLMRTVAVTEEGELWHGRWQDLEGALAQAQRWRDEQPVEQIELEWQETGVRVALLNEREGVDAWCP